MRLAEVGPHLTIRFVDQLLETVGTTVFHPLLPLSEEVIVEEKQRIKRLDNPSLRDQQTRDLEELLDYRDEAAKAHSKQYGSCNYPADIKAGTATIKALAVSNSQLNATNILLGMTTNILLSMFSDFRAYLLCFSRLLAKVTSQTATMNSELRKSPWACMASCGQSFSRSSSQQQ